MNGAFSPIRIIRKKNLTHLTPKLDALKLCVPCLVVLRYLCYKSKLELFVSGFQTI